MGEKKQNKAGKWIVILLAGAIALFLILPFLDGSATVSGAKHNASKATPQIFTSNPLSKLAEKILAAFTRRPKPQAPVFAGGRADSYPYGPFYEEQSGSPRAATTYTEEGTPIIESAYLDDNGEWILIDQIEPDRSSRGMHDIKASDSAYDRLINLERAAKYTRVANPATAPQPTSKWARFFSPVKKFFGLEDKPELVAATTNNQPRSVAAQGGAPKLSGRKSTLADLYLSQTEPRADEDAQTTFHLLTLDPEQALQDLGDNLIRSGKNLLDPKDFKDYEKMIREERRRLILQTDKDISRRIDRDAANSKQDPNLAARFLINQSETDLQMLFNPEQKCGGNQQPSAFYYSSTAGSSGCGVKESIDEQAINEAKQQSQKELIDSINEALEQFGKKRKASAEPLPIAIVLATSAPGDQPFKSLEDKANKTTHEKVYTEYLKVLYEQAGCDKESCMFTVNQDYKGEDLKNTIEASSLKLVSLENNIDNKTVVEEIKNRLTDLSDEEKAKITPELLEKMTPSFTFQPITRLAELRQDKKKPVKIFAGSATVAKSLKKERQRFPAAFFAYDRKAKSTAFSQQNGNNELVQGRSMTNAYADTSKDNLRIFSKNSGKLHKLSLHFISQKTAEKAKANAPASLKDFNKISNK